MSDLELVIYSCDSIPGMARYAAHIRAEAADPGLSIDIRDAWDHPREIVSHRVMELPTVLLVADGVEIDRLAGRCRPERVNRFLKTAARCAHRTDRAAPVAA